MNFNDSPKDYQVLFLDMNSFFASVEQQVQPTLRGKPIGVAPFTGNTGCIIAVSKEAKARGVKIGRIGEIKKICPNIKIIESRPTLYMIYHKEIKKVIESFTPYFEPLSIDEFILRLTPREQNYKAAAKLGMDLKQAICDRVGDYLTCSVGIGPSRFLAKMAGERKKPDGLTILQLNNLKNFYQELKLLDITGINYRMEARLNFLKINSPIDLFDCSLEQLRAMLGHVGRLWYFRMRGYEVDEVESASLQKSKTIGHSHVLPPELRTIKGAEAVIRKLIFKAGLRIRTEKYWVGGISVSVGFLGGGSFHQSKKVDRFCDNKSFMENVFSILKECNWRGCPNYVSITAFNLVRMEVEQISLFSEMKKQRDLSKTIDLINDHYGVGAVFPASLFSARKAAPDRIPFGRPRYDIIH